MKLAKVEAAQTLTNNEAQRKTTSSAEHVTKIATWTARAMASCLRRDWIWASLCCSMFMDFRITRPRVTTIST